MKCVDGQAMSAIRSFLTTPVPFWLAAILIIAANPPVKMTVDWPLLWDQLHCYTTATEAETCDLPVLREKRAAAQGADMNDIDEIVAKAMQEAMSNAHPQQDPHQKPFVSGEIDDVLIDGTVDLRIVASIVRAALLDAGYTIVPVVPKESS